LHLKIAKRGIDVGLSGDVLFLGHCNNVLEIISLFDLLVVCSHTEGFSLVIAEAMAQGKAVVATAVGGIPEVVEHGKSGLLVSAKAPDQMAEGIIKVLKDDELRTQMANIGLQQCRQKFMVSGTVKELRTLYIGLLQKKWRR